MSSSFSPNLAIELIGTGDQSGSWGTSTNNNLGTLIEQAISGYTTQAMADADQTLVMTPGVTATARNMFIECTGALTAARNLTVPANKKLYFIYNNTTGGFAVTVKVSGQTGVSVPAGAKMLLVSNGTDIVVAENTISGLRAIGTPSTLAALLPNAGESCTVSATAAAGTINFDVTTQSVLYYTTNASGNWTMNFRGSSGTSMNTLLAVGQSVTVVFMATQGSTAYYNSAVQVDGVSVTPKYQGAISFVAGNALGIDVYTYVILKTAASTYTVLAAQTRYA